MYNKITYFKWNFKVLYFNSKYKIIKHTMKSKLSYPTFSWKRVQNIFMINLEHSQGVNYKENNVIERRKKLKN